MIFGWKDFEVKSYRPFDLKISQNEECDFNVQVRQNYFHIYKIPFWGEEKFWALEKNGKIYSPPDAYLEKLSTVVIDVKTPWYAFTGFWLVGLLALVFIFYPYVNDYRTYLSNKESIEKTYAEVDNYREGNFIAASYQNQKMDNTIHLKSYKVTSDSILFGLPDYDYQKLLPLLKELKKMDPIQLIAKAIENNKNQVRNNDSLYCLKNLMNFDNKMLVFKNKIWISKHDLKRAYLPLLTSFYDDPVSDFKGIKIPALNILLPGEIKISFINTYIW